MGLNFNGYQLSVLLKGFFHCRYINLIQSYRIRFINKNICGPLIYLKDPSGNQYYDISQNSGSTKEFIQILKNNSRLTNFYLSSNINFNKK